MLKKRHIIRFLVKEGIRILDNPQSPPKCLPRGCDEENPGFLLGGGEVRRGPEDLSDEERPGRPPTGGLDEILAYRFSPTF
jgi:hypothetical protein